MPPVSFYHTKEWRIFRAAVMRERSVCQAPGCCAPATHLDHIVSIGRGGAKLDKANVQALCPSCHSRKTAQVDGGMGNHAKADAVRWPGCGADGMPLDPTHHWNVADRH